MPICVRLVIHPKNRRTLVQCRLRGTSSASPLTSKAIGVGLAVQGHDLARARYGLDYLCCILRALSKRCGGDSGKPIETRSVNRRGASVTHDLPHALQTDQLFFIGYVQGSKLHPASSNALCQCPLAEWATRDKSFESPPAPRPSSASFQDLTACAGMRVKQCWHGGHARLEVNYRETSEGQTLKDAPSAVDSRSLFVAHSCAAA